jgi:hypothetical protein
MLKDILKMFFVVSMMSIITGGFSSSAGTKALCQRVCSSRAGSRRNLSQAACETLFILFTTSFSEGFRFGYRLHNRVSWIPQSPPSVKHRQLQVTVNACNIHCRVSQVKRPPKL